MPVNVRVCTCGCSYCFLFAQFYDIGNSNFSTEKGQCGSSDEFLVIFILATSVLILLLLLMIMCVVLVHCILRRARGELVMRLFSVAYFTNVL